MKKLIKNGSLWNGETFIRADILTEKDIVAKISDKNENRIYDKKGCRCMLTVVNGQIVYRY